MVGVFEVGGAVDAHVVADAAVFVDDGIAYVAAFADAELGKTARQRVVHFFDGLEIIGPHYNAVYQCGTMTNATADAYNAGLDAAGIYNAAFGNDCALKRSAADLGGRQHAGAGINGF